MFIDELASPEKVEWSASNVNNLQSFLESMLPVEIQHRYGTKPLGPEQVHLEPTLDKNRSAP